MLNFKIADRDWEFNEIHKLNYQTFVEEIPQHEKNSSKELVDKFHDQNKYIICLKDDHLIGMVAVRNNRPFSLDSKIDDLDSYLPVNRSICEIRLLSIKKDFRFRNIIRGLFSFLAKYCEERDYELALISATTTQLRLYNQLGFKPFGPLVGDNCARFQPMYLTLKSYNEFKSNSQLLDESLCRKTDKKIILQPGPVSIREEVKNEFKQDPVSHRSQAFKEVLKNTRKLLCNMTNAKNVEILMGSGTLANDCIASQLKKLNGKGLILSNGEFGNRLVDHANRTGLEFGIYASNLKEKFNIADIRENVTKHNYEWIWFVHCETSTGVINDLKEIESIACKRRIKICVDCVSSIGNLPLDLDSVYIASAVSGKGLESYSGLCFVFYNNLSSIHSSNIPRYLDLDNYANNEGVPYTISSNLLYALKRSLELQDINNKQSNVNSISDWIWTKMIELDFKPVADRDHCIPAIITLEVPDNINSLELGEYLEDKRVYIGYQSNYLARNNWIQIALMSCFNKKEILPLISLSKKFIERKNI